MKKPKTGRRASEDDKARARELVTMYRLAQQAPDGKYCFNPCDEPEIQSFIYKDDPGYLLSMLEHFAEHGTFAAVDTSVADRFMLQNEMKVLQDNGVRYHDAVAQLAERHSVSRSTIERVKAKSTKKGPPLKS